MFVVIEGIDGAGCETQANRLSEMLKRHSGETTKSTTPESDSGQARLAEAPAKRARMTPFLVKYPDYTKNVGRFIKDFLYQNKNLTAEEQFLLYSLQFLMDKNLIAEKRKNKIVIADRYFSTTLCFQTLEGIRLDKALRFAKDFQIEKPDMVFYLDVDPEIAIKRKFGEQKEKNRREKDFDFIRKTYQQYQMLVDKQVWTKWVKIDGNRTINKITEEIFNIIKLHL